MLALCRQRALPIYWWGIHTDRVRRARDTGEVAKHRRGLTSVSFDQLSGNEHGSVVEAINGSFRGAGRQHPQPTQS